MTQLADHQILNAINDGDLEIFPFDNSMLQPISIDVQLGNEFRYYLSDIVGPIDPRKGVDPREMATVTCNPSDPEDCYVLYPRQFVLATTVQTITLSSRLKAQIEGRSTIGRLGMPIHVTAGFIDPGFSGQLTLEIYNFNPRAIQLFPGMGIAQLSFTRLGMGAKRPYGHEGLGSKYQFQAGATGPRPLAWVDPIGEVLADAARTAGRGRLIGSWPAPTHPSAEDGV